MGGKALKVNTVRKNTDELYHIFNDIKKYLYEYDIFMTKFYRDKNDHGDLDILIKTDNIKNIFDIANKVKDNEISVNGNTITFDYNNFQIDFICIDDDIWEISKVFFSYDPVGNLLGKIAHGFGLKYGFNGLVYKSIGKRSIKVITLTKDPYTIFNFLGYDFNEFKKGFNSLKDIFNYVINGKYYDKDLFKPENLKNYDRKRSLKRKSFREFLIFSINTKSKYKFSGDYTDYIDSVFPGFKEKIQQHIKLEDFQVENNKKFKKLINNNFKNNPLLKDIIFYYKKSKSNFYDFINDNDYSKILHDFNLFYRNYLELNRMIDKELGFGKKMGNDVYIHRKYENVIPFNILNNNKTLLPDTFNYTIIKWNKKDNSMSFIESIDFNISDEPIVGDSIKIYNNIVKYRKKPNRDQIYHHKWMFVKNDYDGFNYINSKLRSLKWYKKYNYDSKKIGYKDYWDSLNIKENYNNDEIDIANKTNRLNKNVGAVGLNAIVPKYVLKYANKTDKILDFGSGKYPYYTLKLRNEGYNVISYDFGKNITEYHDVNALNKKYDIIFASNVLNVQSSINMLKITIESIINCMKHDSIFIANYPYAPRKMSLSFNDIINILKQYFIVKKEKNNVLIMKLKEIKENNENYSMIIKDYNLFNNKIDGKITQTKKIDWDEIFHKKEIVDNYIRPYEKKFKI